MKLTTFLLLFTVLQVFARGTYSQNTKLTMNLGETTVEQVLKEIENQSEFYFLFNQKLVDINRKVNLQVTEKKIDDILTQIFFGTNVDYVVMDRQIVLSPGEYLAEVKTKLQPITVTGKVTGEYGEPLPGVSIQIKGTTMGTVTNLVGEYTIEVDNKSTILVFSYLGYISQEITVGEQTVIDINMETDILGLEEVVVIGYGTQRRENLTGAVSQVRYDQLETRMVTNVATALQGVLPGLNIFTDNTIGGEPGAGKLMNIRGTGSLTGGEPYVLVDGVPMDINYVNLNDIESVSVLKDAASSAIYGARAPYGVILITTKSGRKGEGPIATYSNYFGWAAPTVLPKFANSLDFANAMNEASANAGESPVFRDEVVERIKQRIADPTFPSTFPDPYNPEIWGTYGDGNDNVEWYDVYYKDWSFRQSHNLGIAGGSQNSRYYLGLGWVDEEGLYNYANDKYQRYNITSNLSSDVAEWLTVGLNAKLSLAYNKYPILGEGRATNRQLIQRQISRSWPTEPLYTPNGDLNIRDITIIPFFDHGGSNKKYVNDIWITPSVEIRLTKDWKINGNFSFNHNNYNESLHKIRMTGLGVDGILVTDHYSQTYNFAEHRLANTRYMTMNIFSKYEKNFNDHSLGVLIGSQAELNNYIYMYGQKKNLVTEEVPSISTATGDEILEDALSHWSTLGVFARLTYNYKGKYLFEFNSRYDGSSRFGTGNRWGFFPSVSAGYFISKENFWEPLSNIINNLKLRASYGSLGNQNVPNYLQIPILPVKTRLGYIINGERPLYTTHPNIASVGLTWETSKTIDFGIDASFLENRLNITFDWFDRKTENMFGPGEILPAVFGTSVPQMNNATLDTKGFDLSAGWRHSINKDLKYELRLTMADNKSVVTGYNNPTKYIYNYYEGQVLGEIWGYETVGFFESEEDVLNSPDQSKIFALWSPGDIKYKDLNGDNIIYRGENTVDDPGDKKVIGNNTPRYLFGMNMNFYYKNFDFSMFLQGVGKRNVWMGDLPFFGFGGYWWDCSITEHTLDYWSPQNTDAYLPKPYMHPGHTQKNQQVQSRYLLNAAYLRLKNIQIGYTLPMEISSKVKISKLRLFIGGENILTFDHLRGPYDPEALNSATYGTSEMYPLSKLYTFGINITF